MRYLRYVAVGDSQTEGLMDGDEVSGYRGWADRLAEMLAAREPEFRYANLAVRGHLAAAVRAHQMDAALALEPDLITVTAGMNDLIRPGCDIDAVAAELDAMLAAFTASGATVVAFTFPDVGEIAPLVARLRPRIVAFNERVRAMAERHGAVLVDTWGRPVVTDPRIWNPDRLHASPLGHARIAAAAAHALGLPGSDASWADPLPPLPPVPGWRRVGGELAWAAGFLGPWVWRRVRGRSSADGRTAKRPELLPVSLP
ncbi:SGNH/GDSL hydrolase family protein [Actinomadura logoneensis]|uniref:SGNH/GDSL hydrolase family protein n=1 Tax=Actinomadura logoneensis TaxID=2293572 RepID=A0A372JN60_9ACTN|nr:SGNH/GDSL hydrolase family protein [Actinomadura logoneensis]RFU41457.1 SGNH/GDSL hydrolase family protein [Actinomadura logoneensis]